VKLNEGHFKLLRRMAKRKECDGPESGPEMSMALRYPRYWATPKLKAMKKAGLAEELGSTLTGGGCFTITEAGRSALNAKGE